MRTMKFSELIILFLGIPLILLIARINVQILITVILSCLAVCLYLKFNKIKIINYHSKNPQNLKYILFRILFVSFLILSFSFLYDQENFLSFPKENFNIYILVMILYPFLSALPQEVLYRRFFFERYEKTFPGKTKFIILNSIFFSLGHIIYLNPIVIGFTFIGSLIFAWNYYEHRSTFWVTLEHAIYGNVVFTSGLGIYFYHGTIQ